MHVRCRRGGALVAAAARDGSLVDIRYRKYSLQEQIPHAVRSRALGRDRGGVRGRAAVSGRESQSPRFHDLSEARDAAGMGKRERSGANRTSWPSDRTWRNEHSTARRPAPPRRPPKQATLQATWRPLDGMNEGLAAGILTSRNIGKSLCIKTEHLHLHSVL